ncbi:hypothetical protein [Longitalea luteola]|uniref:hypothetical protein n=1 Tax=Longitalea luteola TaxID=2812563 RepID=UPI001A95CF51|nr:hypothetical protein [Longitalea luteola]
MNDVFNLNRWLLYIGKHWNENKRKYGLSLSAIGGLLVLWFSFLMLTNKRHPLNEEIQAITYYVGLYLTGTLYASLIFSELGEGPKAIHYLMMPASILEKLLSAILYGVVLFFVCYTIVFYAVDFIMIKVANGFISGEMERQHLPFRPMELVNVFVGRNGNPVIFYMLLMYFAAQSVFLLGSVYFVKFHFIKTLVAGLIVFLILVFFVHKVLDSFMPNGGFFEPFTVYRAYDPVHGEVMVQLPEWLSSIMLFLMKYSLAPCLWVVAYFRLKEKEV